MRLLVLLLLSSVAHADSLDPQAVAKKLATCTSEEARAVIGTIEKVEAIGKRPTSQIVHVTGTKARAYVVWQEETMCNVMPIAGKPEAFAKGNFGNGATVAYALRGHSCGDTCATVISLKTADDKLVDAFPMTTGCEDVTFLTKRSLFPGRDSLELTCWGSAGADPHRDHHLFDAGTGQLVKLLDVSAGVAWYQITDEDRAEDGSPRCQARPPGGMTIKPGIVDATEKPEPEEAEAAKVEWHSGGCESTVATQRYVVEGNKLVKQGKRKFWIAKKLCDCKPKPKKKK